MKGAKVVWAILEDMRGTGYIEQNANHLPIDIYSLRCNYMIVYTQGFLRACSIVCLLARVRHASVPTARTVKHIQVNIKHYYGETTT